MHVPKRKILIGINQFPVNGGSRVEKFVQLLPDYGWEPIILTSTVRVQSLSESIVTSDFSPELRVERVWNPLRSPLLFLGAIFHVRPLAVWLENFLYFPDRWVGWALFARRRAKKIVEEEGIDLIFTSSPEQSVHLIGKWVQEETGVPWIADFRDLWTTQDFRYHEVTRWHLAKARKMEKEFYNLPDHVIANTPAHREVMESEFSVPADRMTVIMNGFDERDFQGDPHPVSEEDKSVFRAAYFGHLILDARPWRTFLEGFRRFVVNNEIRDARLDLYMPPSSILDRWTQEHHMEGTICWRGYRPHREIITLARSYDLLTVLLVDMPSYRTSVPQKLFQSIRMERPILAVIPEEGISADIIRATGTGRIVAAVEPDQVARGFMEEYRAWKEGRCTIDPVPGEIEKYSRQRATQRLSEILNRFCRHAEKP